MVSKELKKYVEDNLTERIGQISSFRNPNVPNDLDKDLREYALKNPGRWSPEEIEEAVLLVMGERKPVSTSGVSMGLLWMLLILFISFIVYYRVDLIIADFF